MLLDDERSAQWDHEQDAQKPAQHRHQQHPANLQIEAQDEDRRHGHRRSEGQRLAGRTRRLGDVVFQNGGIPPAQLGPQPEQRDRDDRDRNGGTHRQSHLEGQVERRSPENDAQQRTHDHGAGGEFAQSCGRRDVRRERRIRLGHGRRVHATAVFPRGSSWAPGMPWIPVATMSPSPRTDRLPQLLSGLLMTKQSTCTT